MSYPYFYTVLSSLTSGDVISPPAQAGGPLLAHAGYSMSPTSDPQTNTPPYPQSTPQTLELMYPQVAGQPQLPLNSAAAGQQAPHARPASGPGVDLTSDTVITLTTFSRLSPEQMRTLFPVLGNIMAAQQPPEASRSDSVPGAPT